jgi:hypothetical protein
MKRILASKGMDDGFLRWPQAGFIRFFFSSCVLCRNGCLELLIYLSIKCLVMNDIDGSVLSWNFSTNLLHS